MEQNGCFKMALAKAKQELIEKKNDASLDFAIDKTDIVGLVQKAWKASFANVDANCKATSCRGWGPKALNYNALNHPEIIASKSGNTPQSALNLIESQVQPDQLNFPR
jgi:hypothetical protein